MDSFSWFPLVFWPLRSPDPENSRFFDFSNIDISTTTGPISKSLPLESIYASRYVHLARFWIELGSFNIFHSIPFILYFSKVSIFPKLIRINFKLIPPDVRYEFWIEIFKNPKINGFSFWLFLKLLVDQNAVVKHCEVHHSSWLNLPVYPTGPVLRSRKK